MLKKLLITIGGLLLLITVLAGTKVLQIMALIAAGKEATVPAEVVTAATAKAGSWERTIGAIGSITAVQGVTVAAESPGKIVSIAFESGSAVKQGDLILSQDTSVEEAQLRSAEASVSLAKLNLDRSKDLLGQHTISQSDYDGTDAQFKQAVAQADNIRAVIAKKTIRAPFSGRLGIRLVNLGQTLKEGDAIVSLQSLDPIYVNFQLPQQRLPDLAADLAVRVSSDALPGKTLEGKISAINPEVDAATRNVRVQATLANADGLLHPGMFATVEVVLPEKNAVIAIPATAVLYAPYGDSVFIVEKAADGAGQVIRQQFVRLGTKRGDFVAVVSGLKGEELVVSSGVFKLRNGMAVVVDNTLAPDAKLAPQPSES
jgi:membrane fusion protein (multidrug efflux system)